MTADLFGSNDPGGPPPPHDAPPGAGAPLADRMRPRSFDELVGQPHLLEAGTPLALMREGRHLASIVLWGPPGSGKTTIARLIARTAQVPFVAFSAVLSGVKEVKETMARAALERRRTGKATVLFVDEIHRFNRAQQDAFLSHVEAGDIVLIGATTENPSFDVNSALLSRARVLVLRELKPEDIRAVLDRALADPERGLGGKVTAEEDALAALVAAADGDARRALNALEIAAAAAAARDAEAPGALPRVTADDVRLALQQDHEVGGPERLEHHDAHP